MEKKLTKEERIREKEKLSAVITNKMAVVFAALVIGIILLVRFGEYTVPSMAALVAVQVVCAVLFAAALVWDAVAYKKRIDFRMRVISAPFALGIAGAMLFTVLFYPSFGAFRLILTLIAFAVLFFVYEIYTVDFFVCSVAVVVSCIAASVINSAGFRGYNTLVNFIAAAISLLACAACSTVVYKLGKDRRIKFFGKTIKAPHGMKSALIYACIAVALLSVIGTLVFGHLLYFVAAACVIYFVTAIIYTVKLM